MNILLCKLVTQLVNPSIKLLAGAAFVLFLYGLVKFIGNISKGGEADDGKRHMVWGIIGLVIIFGAYGIVNVALNTFGIDATGVGKVCPSS